MATKTLEARFEHLSVKDEKETGSDRTYGKHKVLQSFLPTDNNMLT
jgi:aurora kinase